MKRNEIRAKENLPPEPGGDMLTVQSNLVPLDQLGKSLRRVRPSPPPASRSRRPAHALSAHPLGLRGRALGHAAGEAGGDHRLPAVQGARRHVTPARSQARISDAKARDTADAPGGVAVLPVYGVISQRVSMMQDISGGGGTSTEALGAQFRAAVRDDTIKAIVFDGDTPGGGTYGVEELASEIRSARGVKPIVAQVNSLVASAGLLPAQPVRRGGRARPSGEAGSIGVYGVHEDVSKALAKEGVKPTLIRGEKGVHKAESIGFPAPVRRDAHAYLQDRVNRAEDAFIAAVAAGRKTTQANVVDTYGKGRMFGAADLVKRGMADRSARCRTPWRASAPRFPRFAAAADSRRAFAAGANPALSQIEDVLRDAGFPKALAANFVSAGKGALRSESGPEETPSLSSDAKASLAAFLASLDQH
jgi:ClpP class serine protease